MPVWKRFLLHGYYYGCYPHRWWRNRALRAAGKLPVIVLIYHRICDDRANDWTTHPKVFVNDIRWLQKHFDLVPLEEAQRRIRQGVNRAPCVSITFDDGYAANCQTALPLLVKERIPFTYFVSTAPILEGDFFEHDLVMGNRFAPNTLEEIKALAGAGVEIGAHTRTHADLGRVTDPGQLRDELITASEDLQNAVGVPIRYFAFPTGQHVNLSPQAFHLAREWGFEAACSAYGGYNEPGGDPFHLQRVGVDGPMIRLKNWATVDPVKVWKIKRYQYATLPEPAQLVGAAGD